MKHVQRFATLALVVLLLPLLTSWGGLLIGMAERRQWRNEQRSAEQRRQAGPLGVNTAILLPNGKVLVAGGAGRAALYDPDCPTWSRTGAMNTARDGGTATLLPNGKVLVAGGFIQGIGRASSAELYDPASGTWTMTGTMNSARDAAAATLLPNGKVLVAGGYDSPNGKGKYLSSAELYDPATGTWTKTGNLATRRAWPMATLLPNGKVLVAGGTRYGYRFLSSCELYDPATETWTKTGTNSAPRFHATATLLPSGKVLVAGGCLDTTSFSGDLRSAELYDPGTGTWTRTSEMTSTEVYDQDTSTWTPTASAAKTDAYRLGGTHGSSFHTATLLSSGKVLIAGAGVSGRSAEIYDPATEIWRVTGVMNAKHNGHTAVLLPNGKVLVAGGYGNKGEGSFGYLSSPELFDPDTGTWIVVLTK